MFHVCIAHCMAEKIHKMSKCENSCLFVWSTVRATPAASSAAEKTVDSVCSIQAVFRASCLRDDHSKSVGYRSCEITPLLIQYSAQKQPRTF